MCRRRELIARAEVDREGGAMAPPAGEAVGNADPEVVEAAVEDYRAVGRAVHPGGGDGARRAAVGSAPADDLAIGPAVGACEVARTADPSLDRAAAGAVVGEVVAMDHVVAVALRRLGKAALGVQPAEPVMAANLVDQAERR